MTRRAIGAVVVAFLAATLAGCAGAKHSVTGGNHQLRLHQLAEREARLAAVTLARAEAQRSQAQLPRLHGKGAPHPAAAQIALRYLGVPYVWGGASPKGFDSSGLVTYVYKQLGIKLPHYTVSQWDVTKPISKKRMQPGDLVFFDNLDHVGIYIGQHQFVHAPHTGTVVQIASLNGMWHSRFYGARRVP